MKGYALSRDAASDLEVLWKYIAEESIVAADRTIDRLFGVFAALAETPVMAQSPGSN